MNENAPTSRAFFTGVDTFVCVLILCLSAVPLFLYERAPGFVNSDVHYVDLAESLLRSHSYSANFIDERLQPPGLPIILASLCATVGCSHDTLERSMPVFFALGLLPSYFVIRRMGGRLIAAASCLFVAAAPTVFPWVTTRLWPIFPYFLITMIIFLLIPYIDASPPGWRTLALLVLLGILLTAAVIVESIGIALVCAILGWLVFSWLEGPETTKRRIRRFLPVVLLAFLAEGLWLQQGGNRKEWPLPGYPEGYLAQLRIKDGNYPELGYATAGDVVIRIEKNLKESSVFLARTVVHRWINPSWTSVLISGLAILVMCGVWSAFWRTDSNLTAQYFILFELVYLLWPWFSGVVRFAVAVLPFAFFYVAEGARALRRWTRQYPRMIGVLFLPVSVALAIAAMWHGWINAGGPAFQDKVSAFIWIVLAALCLVLIWKRSLPWLGATTRLTAFFENEYSIGPVSFRVGQAIAALVTACFVATGVLAEIPEARENVSSGATKFETTPEIRAAHWIGSHTDQRAVIASSQDSLIYHYSRRRIIWFPPISNPQIVMDGLRKYRVQYVVVIHRGANYYLPPETVCFDLLNKAYPGAFRLVDEEGQMKIYQLLPDS